MDVLARVISSAFAYPEVTEFKRITTMPDGKMAAAPDLEQASGRSALLALVERALAMADELGEGMVAIHLNSARIALQDEDRN